MIGFRKLIQTYILDTRKQKELKQEVKEKESMARRGRSESGGGWYCLATQDFLLSCERDMVYYAFPHSYLNQINNYYYFIIV